MIKKLNPIWKWIFSGILLILILWTAFAYISIWNKTALEFRIHMNKDLIQVSAYGEPPTFAIWLENHNGDLENVYVTRRAYQGDWEGKPEVPVALPYWFHLNNTGKLGEKRSTDGFLDTDAVTGATPREEEFALRVRVPPGSVYRYWIEMNLSGDYNEIYKESDPVKMTADEFGNGQPALVYQGRVKTTLGNRSKPELIGMSLASDSADRIIHPLSGITTAYEVFKDIQVEVLRPKPYIIRSAEF